MPILAWNFPLKSTIFLKRSQVFSILLFFSVSLHWSLRKALLSLLAILWNLAFRWIYFSFSPLPSTSFFFSQLFVRPPQKLFCISLIRHTYTAEEKTLASYQEIMNTMPTWLSWQESISHWVFNRICVLLCVCWYHFLVVCCVAEEEPAVCGANARQPMHGDMRDSAICFPLGCFHATFLLPSR